MKLERPATKILTLDMYSINPIEPVCDHAGRRETSIMLALRPELVHKRRLRGEEAFAGIGRDAPEGNAEWGRRYIEASVARCAGIVKAELKALT